MNNAAIVNQLFSFIANGADGDDGPEAEPTSGFSLKTAQAEVPLTVKLSQPGTPLAADLWLVAKSRGPFGGPSHWLDETK